MLKVIKKKFNIGSNKLAEMKTRNDMIYLDLISLKKLLKIFIFIDLTRHKLNETLKKTTKMDKLLLKSSWI